MGITKRKLLQNSHYYGSVCLKPGLTKQLVVGISHIDFQLTS
jgi:hypothetical protein